MKSIPYREADSEALLADELQRTVDSLQERDVELSILKNKFQTTQAALNKIKSKNVWRWYLLASFIACSCGCFSAVGNIREGIAISSFIGAFILGMLSLIFGLARNSS